MKKETQEINLVHIVGVYIKMWWLILLFVAVGVGSAVFITKTFMVPVYETSTTMFIGKDTDVFSGISMSDLQIDSKLVLDYRELIKTKKVIREVIRQLNLDISYIELRDRLEVDTLSDSRFVSVYYIDVDAERAAQIVNKFSETLVVMAQDIVGVDNIQIVDYADVPKYPSGPNLTMNVILAALMGGFTSILIIFIIHKLDNRIRTKKDIEDLIGITVLTEIPKFKGVK